MKPLKYQILALLLSASAAFSQSSTVFYANSAYEFGTLSGWEARGDEVLFTQLGTFSSRIGGLAVSATHGYTVSFEAVSVYSSFLLSNPSVIEHSAATSASSLDSLVYDPFDGTVYAHGETGEVYTFAADGSETLHGILEGSGIGGSTVQWGSHGDFALAPDSTRLYQVGFDVAMPTRDSPNWHSLLIIDLDDLTSATRIGQIDTTYGLIWGMAFDSDGSLFAVTGNSFMLEIDPTNGGILWHAPIVDSNGDPIPLWDLASSPHSIPEPSSIALVAFGVIGVSIVRRRLARA